MKRRLVALLGAAALVLAFGAGQAAAEEPGAAQTGGQSATSGQQADGGSGAYQSGATNSAMNIRVLSPGDNGSVTQSNTVDSAAIAKNDNETEQDVDQEQSGGGHGSGYGQVAGQSADNKQTADAASKAVQIQPSNGVTSIRVLSPGSNGEVSQSNEANAGAVAANDNETEQSVDQDQTGGSGSGSEYSQIAGQDSANEQSAEADAKAVQLKPSNKALSIRVLSPGDDGDVSQSNNTTAAAAALNDNETDQSIDQEQSGGGSEYSQVAGQEASNDQDAEADAKAVQVKPSNKATSIRVLSPGDDGDVEQSNDATALSVAKNDNETEQSIDQEQGKGEKSKDEKAKEEPAKEDASKGDKSKDEKSKGSEYSQVAGQSASNDQEADADATAVQYKPSNEASSIRVLSPGDGGDVEQSNSTTAVAAALNDNETEQSIDQEQGGSDKSKGDMSKDDKGKDDHGKSSEYSQVAGQEASNDQDADADAKAVQVKPSNEASSIRVLSKGDDGDVEQSNDATAIGIAKNDNETEQSIDQEQGGYDKSKGDESKDEKGKKDDKGSEYSQVAGQEAKSDQDADAEATAVQLKPSNESSSIRVGSKGDGGEVEQSNSTKAVSAALNDNETEQSIDQEQGGGSGSSYEQVAGQEARNDQDADADATAIQLKPSNESSSTRVGSKGDDGDVEQSNDATALSVAKNDNDTDQSIDQEQGGYDKSKGDESKDEGKKDDHGKGSEYSQVAGQEASNDQEADAEATAVQYKPSNEASSIRVGSKGDGGDVEQSNSTTAIAAALNDNETEQSIDQEQGGYDKSKGEESKDENGKKDDKGSEYSQVAGQEASNDQEADAEATAVQYKPSNEASSTRVNSKGDDGDVEQSNDATAFGIAKNDNETEQSIDQEQGGKGSEYSQVAGQEAKSDQDADADATAIQLKPSNEASSTRVNSKGDGGEVEQSNSVAAVAAALNDNETEQSIGQEQGGGSGSSYEQVAGQAAGNDQEADADALAFQAGAENESDSTRVNSKGDDGDVEQSNSVTAIGAALNDNDTDQSIDQDQGGHGSGSGYLQVAGQGSWSDQDAFGRALAAQLGAKNEHAPVRVNSRGDEGEVEQTNAVFSLAAALNDNETDQSLDQEQRGYGSGYLQVGGQGSWDEQRGGAMSSALQGGMRNKKKR
jgi:hypothetical protein